VDLGAAPGGWTWVLLERRAQVIAVDPGRLAPDIARRRGVTHVLGSAFEYAPRAPVDWLFCDMAWRPLEVAALLAKWGRNRWARSLVANVKLPMKQKAEFAARVRKVVEGGGWRDVRARHLYHDRDEITLCAWRTP
jgi:23S rRNA (cytidine2498-2'-O)-methyltransferase